MHLCERKSFTIDKISKDTYSCSLTFVGGNGPTEEDPDPMNSALLECELVRKKDKKKRERPLEWDPLLAKKKKVRTKKHSEMEISPLNSTVQNDATDFDVPLVGDCQHCLPYHPIMSKKVGISFDISYDYVPLQSNEPEVNEENETSKEPSVPASPVKTDKSVNQRRRNTINISFVQSWKHS